MGDTGHHDSFEVRKNGVHRFRRFGRAWRNGIESSSGHCLSPDGTILYKESGSLDILKARRIILSSFPDDDYVGQQAYWKTALALEAPGK